MTEARTKRDSGAFAGWVAVGAAAGFGLLGLLTFGVILLFLAVLGGVLLLRRLGTTAATWGIASGIGLAALFIAWSNRHGPGDVCTETATGGSCISEWSPWPWLVAGCLLVLAGVVGYLVRGRRPGPRSV